ncbi:unnamed protein product [Adineta ricciae]|uniref:G domain-containing protein n=1 Tax=Adineta ricciae TaxID=249248 RepID=A0A814UAJ0_ADIRI|nr:unnamed protein product [Adineta ricciae]
MKSTNESTHFIKEIFHGIEFLILLRVNRDSKKFIDPLLDDFCQSLNKNTKLSNKYSNDQIPLFSIYSNIPLLTEKRTIQQIYDSVQEIESNVGHHWPLTYILHPIETSKSNLYYPIRLEISLKIEEYFQRLLFGKKMFKTLITSKTTEILECYLPEQFNLQKEKVSSLKKEFDEKRMEIGKLILEVRRTNAYEQINHYEILSEKYQTNLKRQNEDLSFHITTLKQKSDFINQLTQRGFQYVKIEKHFQFQQRETDQSLEKQLVKEEFQRILCSNDFLNETNWTKLNDLLNEFNEMKKKDNRIKLFYIDFTYSTFQLNEMKRFPLNSFKPILSQPRAISQSNRREEILHILFLGKIHSGKSMLINTFADFLKSKKRREIQKNFSINNLVIPFFHLIENEFEERQIQIGPKDSNENSDKKGQSFTQQCRSYSFHLENNQQVSLIDTPGFAEHDEKVMQNILSVVNRLTHINAICLIIDSNEKDFNCYQRSFAQLFNYFQENILQNFFICFTKCLSNNLDERRQQSIIKSISPKLQSINRENLFQFDSSYLIQSTIQQYLGKFGFPNASSEQSQSMTFEQWKRFLSQIRNNTNQRYLAHHQGLQNQQILRPEIRRLIRPIFEIIRNLLRNQILFQFSLSYSIEIRFKPLDFNCATCHSCHRKSKQIGPFWIVFDSTHQFSNKCGTCSCPPNQHIPISSYLEYYPSDKPFKYIPSVIQSPIENLVRESAYLSNWLMRTSQQQNPEDLFCLYLERMIKDEHYVLEKKPYNKFNAKLYDLLIILRDQYIQHYGKANTHEWKDLDDIQNRIDKIRNDPILSEQFHENN